MIGLCCAPPPCTYRLKVALSGSDMQQRALIAASGGRGGRGKVGSYSGPVSAVKHIGLLIRCMKVGLPCGARR